MLGFNRILLATDFSDPAAQARVEFRVLYEGKSPNQAVSDLLARANRPEF